jgi:hypothetical protein
MSMLPVSKEHQPLEVKARIAAAKSPPSVQFDGL